MSTNDPEHTRRFLPANFLVESLGIYPDVSRPCRRKDGPNWLSFVSLLISVSALAVTYNQLTITRLDERPWVSATATDNADCEKGRDQGTFLRFKNFGKSVANELFVTVNVVDLTQSDAVMSSKTACGSAIANFRNNSYSIIPGDTFSSASYYSDLSAHRIDIPYMRKEAGSLQRPALVGCATYSSTFDGNIHKTLFFALLSNTSSGLCVNQVYSVGAD